jgi:hypothetical protein
MRYLLLIHSEAGWNELSLEEQNARRERYGAFARSTPAGVILKADELAPTATATTVRVRDGETLVTDGPYAETKEQLGGILVLEARDLDHAVELMSRHPGVKNGPFEVRPAADLTEMVRASEERRSGATA